MQYRRSQAEGASFFFTLVTHNRRPFLCEENHIKLLREAFRTVKERHPFTMDAFVLLPDHLHCIWTLPPQDSDFSTRWRQIKGYFSRHCGGDLKGERTDGQAARGEQSVWQQRFWEHQIRDDRDRIAHVEYIHFNPVKHGLVSAPIHWPHSTFHQYVEQGIYHRDWATTEPITFDQHVGSE
jgi:putative transposase